MKILITEDSKFMRDTLKDVLASEKYEIIEAENGRIGIEKYEKEKPDLVLLDIIMPEVDGIAVLKKIGQDAKVIVISAIGQEKMVEEAKKLGALDFIIKPFESKNVLETIKKVLNQ